MAVQPLSSFSVFVRIFVCIKRHLPWGLHVWVASKAVEVIPQCPFPRIKEQMNVCGEAQCERTLESHVGDGLS